MAQNINYNPGQLEYNPEQLDGIVPKITYFYWCEKCLDYHTGPYNCPYEDFDYCPHCGQLMRLRR